MAALSQATPGIPGQIVDDPSVKESYADTFVGAVFNQGNVTLSFATTRADHGVTPPTNNRVIVDRIVMPIGGAAYLHDMLGQMLKDLEAKGIIKKTPNLSVVQ